MRQYYGFLVTAFLVLFIFNVQTKQFWNQQKLQASEFDIKQSKIINSYSAATFCNINQIQNWDCKVCSKVQKPVEITFIRNQLTNVQGYVAFAPISKKVIVAFRGTKDIKNWIQDLDYQFLQYPRCEGCRIHAGFYAAFYSVAFNVIGALQQIKRKYGKNDIYVTGSSLGAALALVAGIQIQALFGNVKELHLFGCPRVGNKELAKYITTSIPTVWRVIHNRDIVPHVPTVDMNYFHPPFQVLFDQDMEKYRICDVTGQDPSCSDSFAPDYSISDHITYWEKPVLQDVCTK